MQKQTRGFRPAKPSVICLFEFSFSPKYAIMVLRYPDVLLDLCAQAVIEAQTRLLNCNEMKKRIYESTTNGRNDLLFTVKKQVTVRFTHLPSFNEFCKPNISCIRAKDTDGLVQLSGTVIRSGLMKMLEYERCFICNKCAHEFTVSADVEQGNLLEDPKACPMIGDKNSQCKSTKFTLHSTKCTDYQVVTCFYFCLVGPHLLMNIHHVHFYFILLFE